MLVIKSTEKCVPAGESCAIALGYFDGLHTGHRAVIAAASSYADANRLKKAVFTFKLNEGQKLKGALIMQPKKKHHLLEGMGVQYCFEPHFESIKGLLAEDFFLKLLVQKYNAKALFCGQDFRFGAGRSGDAALLQKLCKRHGLHLEIVPAVFYKNAKVSSSRIRQAFLAGNIADANAMLGSEDNHLFSPFIGEK